MRKPRLRPPKRVKCKKNIAAILNAATEVSGINRVGEVASSGPQLVMEVLKDFPLWDYVRKQLKGKT